MADQFLDDLTKIRLKLLQQKIRTEKNPTPALYQNNPHHLLQAEILKNQELVARLKEERQNGCLPVQSREDDGAKDMMTMMMTQNMQLQQLMMQQMLNNVIPQDKKPANVTTKQHDPPAEQQLVEIPDIGLREMTPFTGLPQRAVHHQGTAFKKAQLVPAEQPERLLKHQAPGRGLATPVRPTGFSTRQPSTQPAGFLGQPANEESLVESVYPYPGNRKIRKLRHVCYVVWACFVLLSHLKEANQRRLDAMEHLETLIQQATDELHKKYYLEPGNTIHLSLQDMLQDDSYDMNVKNPGIFHRLSKEEQKAISDLSTIVESIIYEIIGLQDVDGLLSNTRDGILWRMIQDGVFFPPSYLWQEEKKFLKFTDRGAITEVDDQSSIMLVLGVMISRGLVSTLLLKPLQYGLMEEMPSQVASSNLKILGTVLMRIVREVSVTPKQKPMPLAAEVSPQLFSDEEMKFIFKKLDSTFIWSKTNLRNWAKAFVDSVKRS